MTQPRTLNIAVSMLTLAEVEAEMEFLCGLSSSATGGARFIQLRYRYLHLTQGEGA